MNGSKQRKEVEAWWTLVARILGTVVGATIELAQQFGQRSIVGTLAGLAMMGPLIATSFAAMAKALGEALRGLPGGNGAGP